MHRLPKLLRAPALLAALAASLVACAPEAPAPTTGSLRISTSAVVPEIVRVTATLSSAQLLPAIVYDLSPAADGTWSIQIDALPPGPLHVEVSAADAAGIELFHGQGDATIVAGSVAALTIFAQEVAPPPSYGNEPPRIDAIAVSSLSVATGGVIAMNVTASDDGAAAGEPLTYTWGASAGTFSAPASPATQWTAPAAAGPQTIWVEVRDAQGATANASFSVTVQDAATLYGALALTVTLNRAPVVSSISVSPSRLDLGESTTLTAAVADRDGDVVTLSWSAGCPGTFAAAPTAASTTFTPAPGVPYGTLCRLELRADDGHGAVATGWTGVWILPPPTVGPVDPPPPPPVGTGFVNGSFETGDYTGWQLASTPAGIWGIGTPGQMIDSFFPVRDYFTGQLVLPASPLLPVPIWGIDGPYSAFQIPRAGGNFRLSQRLTVGLGPTGAPPVASFLLAARTLSWWRPSQEVKVNVRDLGGMLLATPFTTANPGFPPDGPPMPVDVDLSPFMGQTIVFEVEIDALIEPVAVQLDGFVLR